MDKYDAVVIGAGNGGLVAAIRLLQGGAKVLLVENKIYPAGFRPASEEAGSTLKRHCTNSTTSGLRITAATCAICSIRSALRTR